MDHNCINKNPWKFHDSSLLYTIVSLIHPTNLLWWPPRSKKLTAELVLYQVWIILVWLWISKSFMFLPQSAQYLHLYPSSYIFFVSYDLNDLFNVKKGHTHNIYKSGLICSYFIFNLSKFDIFMTINGYSKIFFPYFSCSDLWWSP